MPKIQDIISYLHITREELAAAYKKVIGKALSARAVNLKDDEWELVKSALSEGNTATSTPKASAKKTTKAASKTAEKSAAEKDDSKVLKGDEIFGGDDFLSGLGFGPKKEDELAESEEEVEVPAAKEAEAAEEMKVSFGNARVIISAPINERKESDKRKERPADRPGTADNKNYERRAPQTSESAGKTFHTFSNTSFSQGTQRGRFDNKRPGSHGH